MSQWRKDILSITSSTEPISFSLWVSLMNVFEKHVDELDLEDVKIIVDKVEEYRIYLNNTCNSGIRQNDVFPNVYKHLESMSVKDIKHKSPSPIRKAVMVGINV